ncbi:MAG: helix-turn-helix transcriptional regulator [Patescibacteria group bacterium]|nr:helix-turn-helix transcriptional regulator [Patescibacteria group bacterium]
MMEKEQLKLVKSPKSMLASRLHDCLADKNISLLELSKIINIPYATLYRLFNDNTPDPKVSVLKALAEYFGLSLDALLDLSDEAGEMPHCIRDY